MTDTAEAEARILNVLPLPPDRVWPVLGGEALYGLPGQVVRTLDPHTESDPVAVLVSYLTAFGNALNATPHMIADGAHHPCRLNAVIVGRSSRSRKGTSWRNVKNVMRAGDQGWTGGRVLSGLSSGEGLITAVSDGEQDKNGLLVGAVDDKRLLVVEEEFSRPLAVKGRDNNTLSAVIRQAYDEGNLRSMTKKPLVATGAHISILGHITVEELRRSLTETDMANGFGNRFLWALARRSKLLPDGGNLDDQTVLDLGRRTAKALDAGRRIGRLYRSLEAQKYWDHLYRSMAGEDECEGLGETLLSRAEAHLLRLSLIYAVTDGSHSVELDHLRAGEAVWRYCEASVAYIFADAMGDPMAEQLLKAVRAAMPQGLDRAGQHREFGNNVKGRKLDVIRDKLLRRGLVVEEEEASQRGPNRLVLRLRTTNSTNSKARFSETKNEEYEQ